MREGGGKRVTAKAGPPLLRLSSQPMQRVRVFCDIFWHAKISKLPQLKRSKRSKLHCCNVFTGAAGQVDGSARRYSTLHADHLDWCDVGRWILFWGTDCVRKNMEQPWTTFSILPSGLFIFILCGFDGLFTFLLTLLTVLSLLVTVSSCYSSYSS